MPRSRLIPIIILVILAAVWIPCEAAVEGGDGSTAVVSEEASTEQPPDVTEPAKEAAPLEDTALEVRETAQARIGSLKESLGDKGDYSFLGVSPTEFILSFVLLLIGFTAREILKGVFRRIGGFAEKRGDKHLRIIFEGAAPPLGWALVVVGLWFAVLVLPINPDYYTFIHKLFLAGCILIGMWILTRLVDILTNLWAEGAEKTETKLDDQIVPIVRSTSKVFVILIGIVMVLQNVGVNVTGLFAGLGIGGMALALASQDFMTNLFGGVVIFLDRPFQIGDWIEVGDWEGTVEEVGLRTTRVRTFARSLITVPNQVFTSEKVNNWSRMGKRRIKTSIGLTYDTTADQMQAAVDKIKQIIVEDENIRDDFYLVNFNNFGTSSLDIFVYCFTYTTNWEEFMDAQQKFFLTIMRALKEMGLEVAFPTTTVHLAPGHEEGGPRRVPD